MARGRSFWSFCASWMTSCLLLTLIQCHAEIVSSLFHSLSTAVFGSGISATCGIRINLCIKLSWLLEFAPLSAIRYDVREISSDIISLVVLRIHEIPLYKRILFFANLLDALSLFPIFPQVGRMLCLFNKTWRSPWALPTFSCYKRWSLFLRPSDRSSRCLSIGERYRVLTSLSSIFLFLSSYDNDYDSFEWGLPHVSTLPYGLGRRGRDPNKKYNLLTLVKTCHCRVWVTFLLNDRWSTHSDVKDWTVLCCPEFVNSWIFRFTPRKGNPHFSLFEAMLLQFHSVHDSLTNV